MKSGELRLYTLDELCELKRALQYELLRYSSVSAASSSKSRNKIAVRRELARVMTRLSQADIQKGS